MDKPWIRATALAAPDLTWTCTRAGLPFSSALRSWP